MLPFSGSPEAAYATKGNILFPGTSAQATAANTRAVATVNDRLAASGATISSLTVKRS